MDNLKKHKIMSNPKVLPQDVVDSVDNGDKIATKPAEKPVSLHPLEFEEAVRELFNTKSKRMEKGCLEKKSPSGGDSIEQ